MPTIWKSHEFDFNEILALILSSNPNLVQQLRLRQLDNDILFDTYITELKLGNLSPYYIKKVWGLLSKFKDYLNQNGCPIYHQIDRAKIIARLAIQPWPLFGADAISKAGQAFSNFYIYSHYFKLSTICLPRLLASLISSWLFLASPELLA